MISARGCAVRWGSRREREQSVRGERRECGALVAQLRSRARESGPSTRIGRRIRPSGVANEPSRASCMHMQSRKDEKREARSDAREMQALPTHARGNIALTTVDKRRKDDERPSAEQRGCDATRVHAHPRARAGCTRGCGRVARVRHCFLGFSLYTCMHACYAQPLPRRALGSNDFLLTSTHSLPSTCTHVLSFFFSFSFFFFFLCRPVQTVQSAVSLCLATLKQRVSPFGLALQLVLYRLAPPSASASTSTALTLRVVDAKLQRVTQPFGCLVRSSQKSANVSGSDCDLRGVAASVRAERHVGSQECIG